MEIKDDREKQDEIEALVKKRDNHVHRLFYMMLEFFLIFGIPAVVAFFAGRALDASYDSGKVWLVSLLVVAFVLSWVIVIFRVRKVMGELKVLDERIKSIREGTGQ